MGIGPIPHPAPTHRPVGIAFFLGHALLGPLLTPLRFLLVALLDIFLMIGQLALWFRRLLFWLGLLTLASTVLDYPAANKWTVAVTAVGAGLVIIALARVSLLLDDKLRFWHLQLHAWAQGWPITRYAFTVLPPRR